MCWTWTTAGAPSRSWPVTDRGEEASLLPYMPAGSNQFRMKWIWESRAIDSSWFMIILKQALVYKVLCLLMLCQWLWQICYASVILSCPFVFLFHFHHMCVRVCVRVCVCGGGNHNYYSTNFMLNQYICIPSTIILPIITNSDHKIFIHQ